MSELKQLDQLVFADESTLEVLRIIGGPRIIDDVERDTLTIELRPREFTHKTFDQLAELFGNTNLTKSLRLKSMMHDEVYDIGEGYCQLVSVNQETRKVKYAPGTLYPTTTKTVVVVVLAQLTAEEMKDLEGDSA